MMPSRDNQRRQVLSYPEGAARLAISNSTFRRRVNEGQIKTIRLGPRRVGVTDDEIERYIDEAEKA
jgi:excisionase family DNA binding protein